MRTKAFLLVALIAPLGAAAVSSAEFKIRALADGTARMELSGEILPGDAERMAEAMLTWRHARRPPIVGLGLDSIGGNVLESISIAMLVDVAQLVTVVSRGERCFSACFNIFASGRERIASAQASLGVHSASIEGEEASRALALTAIMARALAAYGVPDRVIAKMVTTPSTDMYVLRENDLGDFAEIRP